MKKESLSVMTVKTLLAVLLFAGIGTIIIGGGYIIGEYSKNGTANQITKPANQEVENYYDALEKKCDGDSCCLSSLEYMKENNYKEADDNGRCSEGFDRDMMACITSYHWCVPIKEKNCAKVGEFVNPDNLKGKTSYPDVCCEGLKGVNAYKVNKNGECEVITGTPYLTCIPCGNGVCDEIGLWFENKCNCPEDCGNETDASDWQTYRNEEFGFEVKYPEGWKQCEGENICFRKDISFDHPRRFTEINIKANQNNQNLSLDKIVFDFENNGYVYEQKEYITINNKKAFKAEIANWGMVSGKQFLIVGERYWYDIIVDGTNVEDIENDQILSTFKFIEN